MSTATASFSGTELAVDPLLQKVAVDSLSSAMTMCGLRVRCVGISAVPMREAGQITGMIGVHGKVSGFLTLNLGERMALQAVGGLLQDNYSELSSQVIDGVGEITNIVVGGVKSALASTPWGFSHITVPSVIVGTGYQIAYARGLAFASVLFENDDTEALRLEDRLLQLSMSLLRL